MENEPTSQPLPVQSPEGAAIRKKKSASCYLAQGRMWEAVKWILRSMEGVCAGNVAGRQIHGVCDLVSAVESAEKSMELT
ncbi:hypothetical protein Pelo_10533 [Pelomyxa schiedti]|nr:hypothetical protein Pelo_10533 [Pelomyxa schiedti]